MTMWRARGAGGETRRALAHATEASRAHNTSPRVGERNPQVRACAPSAGKYRVETAGSAEASCTACGAARHYAAGARSFFSERDITRLTGVDVEVDQRFS